MSDAFAFDDPAWDTARDAFGVTKVRPALAALCETWDQETADGLLFSHLLHQDTIYPATFLALPHVIRLADTAQGKALGTIASFLGGVALSAQLPATSGGVSLAEGEPFAATPLGQRAGTVFDACRPDIARICIDAFSADPFCYFASGLAACESHIDLALWLAAPECGGFLCPVCGSDNEWLLFGDDLAVYAGQYSLDDWRAGTPETAHGIARKSPEPPEVTHLRARLGPPDPSTNALLVNYRATATCPTCGWQGVMPDPRSP